jgi:hypothetical protein
MAQKKRRRKDLFFPFVRLGGSKFFGFIRALSLVFYRIFRYIGFTRSYHERFAFMFDIVAAKAAYRGVNYV